MKSTYKISVNVKWLWSITRNTSPRLISSDLRLLLNMDRGLTLYSLAIDLNVGATVDILKVKHSILYNRIVYGDDKSVKAILDRFKPDKEYMLEIWCCGYALTDGTNRCLDIITKYMTILSIGG